MIADWIVQAALKLVLEPMFEADFEPGLLRVPASAASSGDAIAEIHRFGTQGYQWVPDADIEACLTGLIMLP